MNNALDVSQAGNRFKQLLIESGFDFTHPDASLGWKVFKHFANEPVNCADDSLHCLFGRSAQTDIEKYNIVFSRQFEINDEEKFYDHLEVVRLIFSADATDTLIQYHASLSTVGFRSFEAFFTALENLPAFQVIATATAWQCEIKTWRTGANT